MSWTMASRTETIFKAVRSQHPPEILNQPPSRSKDTCTSKEMTSVAIYFCSVLECYKIDEMIRYEHINASKENKTVDLMC